MLGNHQMFLVLPKQVTKTSQWRPAIGPPGFASCFPVSNLSKALGSKVGQRSPTAETFQEAVPLCM